VGTSYGNEVSFTTIAVPLVTTTAVTPTTGGNATTGGNVTDAGGLSVTARGVCWNTTGSPTTSDNKTSNGTGTGVYASSPSGLTLGTKYYLRAYATNSEGTGYGIEEVFFALAIGDSYQGGTVARIYQSGDPGYVAGQLHGIVASAADNAASGAWSNINVLIGATAQSNSNGTTNTNAIIGQGGHTASAAKVCRDYNGGGYNDWYLPAYDELNWLYANYGTIGGFTSTSYYWSSTETPANLAYRLRFDGTGWLASGKGGTAQRVRAVRKF
jgi:hypothetical protein